MLEKTLKLNGLGLRKKAMFFDEKGFADAVFAIWLGPKPALRGSEEGAAGLMGWGPRSAHARAFGNG